MSKRRNVLLVSLCLALPACAVKGAYLPTPEPAENLNAALAGVSLDQKADGSCTVLLAIKGSGTGVLQVPRAWCEDAKRAKATLATVPPPAPAPKAGEVK